jgi:hypothetical protein
LAYAAAAHGREPRLILRLHLIHIARHQLDVRVIELLAALVTVLLPAFKSSIKVS